MSPGAWLLFAIFGLAALQSAVGLAVYRPRRAGETVFSTPEADATHLVMNAVMAAMVTPVFTPGLRALAVVLLASAALGVAAALIRHRPEGRSRGPLSFRAYLVAAAYHVLMLAAMIYAQQVMALGMAAVGARSMSGMAPMGTAPHRWLSLPRALALLFGLDALTGTLAMIALPHQLLAAEAADEGFLCVTEPSKLSRRILDLRIGFIPHLVMDAGMVWMLFAS